MQHRRTLTAISLALLGCVTPLAHAADLMDVWQAVRQYDPDVAIEHAARDAGQTRHDQANSLWKPTVTASANTGLSSADSQISGANFSAPGFGSINNAAFNTAIHNGTATGWNVELRQAIFSRERDARGKQLDTSADVAQLQWQAAEQTLRLTTAQRYFGVVIAERKLALLNSQLSAVQKTLAEAKDRFVLGDAPVTSTYEATARAQALQAQVVTAQIDLQMAKSILVDSSGLPDAALRLLPPSKDAAVMNLSPLTAWESDAIAHNPTLHIQQANIDLAHQEVQALKAQNGATLDLVAQSSQQRLDGSGDFGNGGNLMRQQSIGLQLTIPLYTGGYRSAKHEEAVLLADKAESELVRARMQIHQQIQAAWWGCQAGTSRIAALEASLQAGRSRLDATYLGRKVGDRTTLDVLTAENDLSSAELALLQARVDVLMYRMQLALLTGQLDDELLRQINTQLQH